jgi:hypothetical protein
VAPEPDTVPTGNESPVGLPAAASAEPQWPTEPQWPASQPAQASQPSSSGLAYLGRPAAASGGMEALWAESARAVASLPHGTDRPVIGGVQPCISCGLSLSATARFCRRCGTRQG